MPIFESIGFVVIGRNEGDRLKACLRSIPRTCPTTYVDSASEDDSVGFARSLGVEVRELELSKPFTAARARNEGFAHLLKTKPELEYVQFIDGDCQLEPGWLIEAEEFVRTNSSAAVVCGRRREREPHASFYNALCDEEWNTPVGRTRACGGDSLVRVKAFKSVGGFDDALTAGEEPELCLRLREEGWEIWRLDSPMTIHDAAMFKFRQWWRRAVRSGYGYAQAWLKTTKCSHPLYQRELARAFGWTAGVTALTLVASAALGPEALLLGPAVWSIQIVRVARRRGWMEALHLLVGKFAETLGAFKYMAAHVVGRAESSIFYK